MFYRARGAAALIIFFAAVASGARAADYPAKPIRLIVAQSAGGNADFVARYYAQRMTEQFGQQIVIDNRAGGSGVVGTELVAHAPPDGYTLLLAPTSHAINPNFVARLPYDARRDFTSISLLGAGYNLLVVSQTNAARSVRDVITAARAQPGQLRYASSGVASATQLTTELFRLMAGIEMLHVPYKGAPAALTAARFDRHLAKSDLPLIVDFWAAWCGPCQAIAPIFAHAAAELEPRARFIKIDVDANPELSARYGIRGIPALFCFAGGIFAGPSSACQLELS